MTEYRQHPDKPRIAQYRTGRRKWRDVALVFYGAAFVAAWVAMMNDREAMQ